MHQIAADSKNMAASGLKSRRFHQMVRDNEYSTICHLILSFNIGLIESGGKVSHPLILFNDVNIMEMIFLNG